MIPTPPRNSDKLALVAYLTNKTTLVGTHEVHLEKTLELFWIEKPHTHSQNFTKIHAYDGDVVHRQRDGTYWLWWANTWTGPFPNRGAITAAVQLLL